MAELNDFVRGVIKPQADRILTMSDVVRAHARAAIDAEDYDRPELSTLSGDRKVANTSYDSTDGTTNRAPDGSA